MSFLELLNAHPALGITLSTTVMFVALCLHLSVRRVCLAVERCKGAAPVRRARKEAAPEPTTKICGRCGKETGNPERHEIYCSVNEDNAQELRAALTNLGYKTHEIDKVLPKLDLGAELPVLIKKALAEMPSKAKAVQ